MKYTLKQLQELPLTDQNDKRLWIIYEYACFPSVLAAKLRLYEGSIIIWGYSVYKGEPGYRTLGITLDEWAARNPKGRGTVLSFYDNQEEMMSALNKLITPKA